MKKRMGSIMMAMLLVLSMSVPAFAVGGEKEDVVILYTNDVHTYIDNQAQGADGSQSSGLRYSTIAALKDSFENVLLVDAGDHIQGTAFGSMDNGETIVNLMNAAGYDLATLGNHEFDYGMTGTMKALEWAEYEYVSCNFYHEKDGVIGESVLAPYQVFEMGGQKIAIVGITTPESFTSSTPAYFQNEAGEYIYGISRGEDGQELYDAVQKTIDDASAQADIVIGLGHLGVDLSSSPWTSREVIANTCGFDAFIDGHSHTSMEGEWVADEDGHKVLLTQTGSYLDAVGKMTIDEDGAITTELLEYSELTQLTPDAQVKALEDAWISDVDERLGVKIGSINDVLDNYDAQGNRLVRSQETNTGDFTADALYYLFDSMDMDVDVAVMNGGGIRNKAITGELSYQECKEIHTFGNVACLQTITGQQLLDALEWGARDVGVSESGAFLQVSGLKYTVDTTIPCTVQKDEKGVWCGSPTGLYRVRDVQIWDQNSGSYRPLELEKKYNLAGYNYTLRDLGDGFAMFDGAVNVLDYVMEDYMVLANYVQSFENGVITGYETTKGRITIITAEQKQDQEDEVQTYVVQQGDTLWRIAKKTLGSGEKWEKIYQANQKIISKPELILVGQVLTIPAA